MKNLTYFTVQKGAGGIHIKKKNQGKFTQAAKRAGMSVQAYASKVLNDPNASATMKKRANFARNAAKWKHADGGSLYEIGGVVMHKYGRKLNKLGDGGKEPTGYSIYNVPTDELQYYGDDENIQGANYRSKQYDLVAGNPEANASYMMKDPFFALSLGENPRTLFHPGAVLEYYLKHPYFKGDGIKEVYPEFDLLTSMGLAKDALTFGKHLYRLKGATKSYSGVPLTYRPLFKNGSFHLDNVNFSDDAFLKKFRDYNGQVFTTDNYQVARYFANHGGGHEKSTNPIGHIRNGYIGEVFEVAAPKNMNIVKAPKIPEHLAYTDRNMPLITDGKNLFLFPETYEQEISGWGRGLAQINRQKFYKYIHPQPGVPIPAGMEPVGRTLYLKEALQNSGRQGVEIENIADGIPLKPNSNYEFETRLSKWHKHPNNPGYQPPMTERIYFDSGNLYKYRPGTPLYNVALDYAGITPLKGIDDISRLLLNSDRYSKSDIGEKKKYGGRIKTPEKFGIGGFFKLLWKLKIPYIRNI